MRTMNLAKKTLLFFFTFTLLAKQFLAEDERSVSLNYNAEAHQIHNEPYQFAYSFFGNLTVYMSILDDIFSHLSSSRNVSENCRLEASLLKQKANAGDAGAIRFLDASGKPPSGILEGGTNFIGFYSECVTAFINVTHTEKSSGQYCVISLNFSASEEKDLSHSSWQVINQKPPTFGVCIPSSCSHSDLDVAVSLSLDDNLDSVQGDVVTCHANPSGFSDDVGALVMSCLLVIFILIAIAATITDIIQDGRKCLSNVNGTVTNNAKSVSREVLCEVAEPKPSKRNVPLECLLAFSFRRNAKKIFTVEGGGENISCVHGLKFLSMALIILGHTFSFATQNLTFRNPGAAGQAPKDFLSQIFANGTLAVDTFYFISGLLVAYVTLKYLEKTEGKLNLLQFYFHRYFRLTPLMMMAILISAYLIRYVESGPNWLSSIKMYDEWCRENAYLNAVYLHNFINTEHMCMSHTWYLATDMQFYFVVPAILIPLYKSRNYGVFVAFIFLLATSITTGVLTAVNHYPAIPYINNVVPQHIMDSYYKNVYIKPYCRMGPYIVGILVGYMFLHKKELKLKKLASILWWISSVTLGLTIIYLMWPANLGHIPTDAQAAAYSSLARTLWGVCIGWLVIACYYGYAGFINNILSWAPFVPLSRLTYCAYLIHPVVINVHYGSIQTVVDYSLSYMIYLFLGNICITFMIATFLSLMFESPFVVLEKVIMSKRS